MNACMSEMSLSEAAVAIEGAVLSVAPLVHVQLASAVNTEAFFSKFGDLRLPIFLFTLLFCLLCRSWLDNLQCFVCFLWLDLVCF